MSVGRERYCEELRAARERFQSSNISDPALTACIAGLARIEDLLRRPLRIVILGEYNSGKTSVADLLIGKGVLPTSVISNTRVPVLIGYAPSAALYGIDRNGTSIRIDGDADDPLTDLSYRAIQLKLPLPWLQDYQVLDTPPLGSPQAFIEEADIVVWCTVATRAWTESERVRWTSLPQRCYRHALLVATHKDSIHTEDECLQVIRRLRPLTQGLFRDVVMVDAGGVYTGSSEMGEASEGEARKLREAVTAAANDIFERRLKKASKIVRRLARLTFHDFGKAAVRAETVSLLASWELHASALLDQLAQGRRSPRDTVEAILFSYAIFAEKLRAGVVTGDAIAHSSSRALTVPVRWPAQPGASLHLVKVLISDLTGLLRMLAGTSSYVDPLVRAEHQAVRATMLGLADLDGSFDALGRMLGAARAGQR